MRISEQTLRNEERRDHEFKALTHSVDPDCVEDAEAELYRRAMKGSDTLLKFYLAVKNPQKYSQRHLLEYQGRIDVDHEVRLTVVEDDGWYENTAHDLAAARLAAPDPGSAIEGTVQGGDVRPPVGQNGHGSNGHGKGPRPQ